MTGISILPTFNLRQRGNGYLSSAACNTGNALTAHTTTCENNGGGCGPGKSVLTDDGWQPTTGHCAPAAALSQQWAQHVDDDRTRDTNAHLAGTWPQSLLSDDDRRTLLAELAAWFTARPGIHYTHAWLADPADLHRPVTLTPDQDPHTRGWRISIPAAVAHLAGYAVHANGGDAHATGHYLIRYELFPTAQRLLALTDLEARRLLHADAVDPLSLLDILAR